MGCGHTSLEKASNEEINIAPDIEQIRITDIDENSVMKYSEIFDSIRFVRLETTDNSLIGRVDKIIVTDDRFVILDASIAKMVFVFDKNGKFLNRIGKNGNGPGEYDEPDDIVYDKYNDELLILCANKKTIMRFNFDGNFIDDIKTDWWASSIMVVAPNTYLLYLNNISQKNSYSDRHNILVINEKGNVLKELFPAKDAETLSFPAKHAFSFYGDEIVFTPCYDNIIYKLNDNSCKEKYFLDFGKYKIPQSFFKNTTFREFDKKIKNGDYAFSIGSIETDSHVICQFVYKGKIFDCFYSKNTKNTKITSVYLNDINALASGRSFNSVDGNFIIDFVEPQSFVEFRSIVNNKNVKNFKELLLNKFMPPLSSIFNNKLKHNFKNVIISSEIKLSQAEIDFINSINETDNPIIRIATLRNF
jgi:hypothetical protein